MKEKVKHKLDELLGCSWGYEIVQKEVSENGFIGSYGAKTFCSFLY